MDFSIACGATECTIVILVKKIGIAARPVAALYYRDFGSFFFIAPAARHEFVGYFFRACAAAACTIAIFFLGNAARTVAALYVRDFAKKKSSACGEARFC